LTERDFPGGLTQEINAIMAVAGENIAGTQFLGGP
jgi:hypothetical protein